jgi:hypothetical protein
MTNPTQICVFNPLTNLVDVAYAAVVGPGVPGAPVALNSNGVVDSTLLQLGTVATTGEALFSGNLVNLYESGSTLYVQLAYAGTTGTPPSGSYPVLASGFVSQTAGIGSPVTVAFSGIFYYADTHGDFSVSSIGQEVYLSAVDKGGITLTRPLSPPAPEQSVGYVLSYNSGTVGVLFIAGFNDFSRISGIAQIGQGGTAATTGAQALINLGAAPSASPTFTGTVTLPATVNSANLGLNIADNSTSGINITESNAGVGGIIISASATGANGVAIRALSGTAYLDAGTIGIGTVHSGEVINIGSANATVSITGGLTAGSVGITGPLDLNGVVISITAPSAGKVLVASSPTAAAWGSVPTFVGAVASPPTSGVAGLVPASTAVEAATYFLRADGTWNVPAGGGSAGVSSLNTETGSVTITSPNSSITVGGTNPITLELPAVPKPLCIFAPGVGTDSQILFRGPLGIPMTFPINATLSLATAGTGATLGTTFSFSKNGVPFATCVFGSETGSPPAGETGTYTQASAISFSASDILEVDGPGTADATLADICLTLVGNG